MEGRKPLAGFLNYKGDVSQSAVGQAVGPNAFGEILIAVEATFNPETGLTHVGFDYAREGDL